MIRVAASFLLLVCGLMLVPLTSHAQTIDQPVTGYVMKRWTTAEGLPHNSIVSPLQTRDGYLWIGTGNAGLARFDGLTFTSFTTFNILNEPTAARPRRGRDAPRSCGCGRPPAHRLGRWPSARRRAACCRRWGM